MEAILLAGGKAERLGDAAGGRPKALVEVAGRPLAAYQVVQLGRAGVTRVLVSCASGQEELFERELAGLGPEIVAVGEDEPLGRGGGARLAAAHREENGPVYLLNGDELIDVDLGALLDAHRSHGGAATIVVAPLPTEFGVVQLDDDDRVRGFDEAPRLQYWAHAGVNVLDDEAVERLPERGGGRQALRLPPRGALADGEHPERPAPRRGAPARESGLAPTRDDDVSEHLESPNLGGLETFSVEPTKVDKPWGWELIWARTDDYCGKLLFVQAGESLSLQFHREKDESWYVESGRARIEIAAPGDAVPKAEVVGPGAAFRIPPGTVHRVTALDDTMILEVSTPQLEDVVRLEDSYGRAEGKP
jgi:mannose-6-phosphate isomerase-like protein (cupin superfamily)